MRLEVGSGWAPGGLCVGSVRSPMRFGVGSWWAPGGLRALSHAVLEWAPDWFRVGSMRSPVRVGVGACSFGVG